MVSISRNSSLGHSVFGQSRGVQKRPGWVGPRGWLKFLRAHQRDAITAAVLAMEGRGFRLLGNRRGAILADDVGMGKTFEALGATVLYLARNGWREPVFLVPPALHQKWLSEWEKFKDLADASTQNGPVRRILRKLDAVFGERCLHKATRAAKVLRSRQGRRAKLVVLDEAHKARSRSTKLAQALVGLKRLSSGRIRFLFLTATPFQCDRSRELIHLLSFLDSAYEEDYRAGDANAKTRGREPTARSIVNAIDDSLKFMERYLKDALEACPEECEERLARLLKQVDKNHDLVRDPLNRTFGVSNKQDGFDEYMRSLVIRTPKPQPGLNSIKLEIQPGDAALYLFGRAYLRSRSRADDGEDPPPGAGFLPNGYSRLCSAYGALFRPQAILRHPHAQVLRRLSKGEPKHGATSFQAHAKLRLLRDRMIELSRERKKVVIFYNHCLSMRQARRMLLNHPGIGRALDSMATDHRRRKHWKPRKGELVAAVRTLAKSRCTRSIAKLPLDEVERVRLHAALSRHVAGTRSDQRMPMAHFWRLIFEEVAKESPANIRRTVRGLLMKSERNASRRKLLGRLGGRHYKAIEILDGSVPMPKRTRLLKCFNAKDVAPFVLLVSQAGSEGQDMHGACKDVIHHDLHWNPTVQHQRTGRVYRDQVKAEEVEVIRLEFAAGYDQTILKYAEERDNYRDFLLGDKLLADFLQAKGLATYQGNRRYSWRMDLRPDRCKV